MGESHIQYCHMFSLTCHVVLCHNPHNPMSKHGQWTAAEEVATLAAVGEIQATRESTNTRLVLR